jgi:hypothetical protein
VAHPPLLSVANPLLKEYFIIEKNGRIVKILSIEYPLISTDRISTNIH